MFAKIALAGEKIEYCGLPYPIPGERLILEPGHPCAALYETEANKHIDKDDDVAEDFRLVNVFYSKRRGADIYIWFENGKYKWGMIPAVHSLDRQVGTIGCSIAWSLEAEAKAQQMLGTMLSHHAFRCYLLTGSFLESSNRSRVSYIFRRLRPTVAIVPGASDGSSMRILAALCMHPLGYYAGTFAGGLVPTDDVIAHLLMMRSDEHLFWKRCNQHNPSHPNAGM